MTREYAFAKNVTEEQAQAILTEGAALQGADKVVINDFDKLVVTCETSEDFEYVMERLVNIVSRLTGGNSFSFTRFVYEG